MVFPLRRQPPSGPLLPPLQSGLIQMGWDQNTKTQTLLDEEGFVPRDATPNPLQVDLPGVVEGNFLEVDWSMTLENESASPNNVEMIAVAYFGPDPVPPFFPDPTGTEWAILSQASDVHLMPASNPTLALYRGFGLFEVPADAERALVRVIFNNNDAASGVTFYGNDVPDFLPSVPTLKVVEFAPDVVTQAPPTSVIVL